MTINPSLFSSAKGDWATPDALYEELDREFNFVLDVCAHAGNHKHKRYYSPEDDSLSQDWTATPGAKWMNPPYGRQIGKWVKKAAESKGVVALLPARVDTRWFHDYVWDSRLHQPKPGVEVRFLPGRLKFKGAPSSAPFPSVVVVWR